MMGWATAIMHLGTPGQRRAILRYLGARRPAWLAKSAQRMGESLTRDWRKWSKITRDE